MRATALQLAACTGPLSLAVLQLAARQMISPVRAAAQLEAHSPVGCLSYDLLTFAPGLAMPTPWPTPTTSVLPSLYSSLTWHHRLPCYLTQQLSCQFSNCEKANIDSIFWPSQSQFPQVTLPEAFPANRKRGPSSNDGNCACPKGLQPIRISSGRPVQQEDRNRKGSKALWACSTAFLRL